MRLTFWNERKAHYDWHCENNEIADKLAAYEGAEEQGRLVILREQVPLSEGGSMKVELTEVEAESLLDFLELNFIRCIKDNPDLDSMLWMDNMMNIWRKCGGRKQYADGEESHNEP